mmetsp:Transcript_5664/g.14029  ORF Transcript_5664/g.14029 Transcript_5664/m.14029 type:complete len:289 (+) Transcript_5664:3782-4648(+)
MFRGPFRAIRWDWSSSQASMRRRIPIAVSSVIAIPNKQHTNRHAADRAFMPPEDLSRDSQSILEFITRNKYVIVPASRASINRSSSSEDAPDGCCHANMSTAEAASNIPKQRGAVSPRRVEGAVMLSSLAASTSDERTCRECNSMIASAEHNVKDPRIIPADSLILAAGVSFADPSDCMDDDFNTSSATSMSPSSLREEMARVRGAGALFRSIPSSYFPPAQDFPISPTASTVAASVSMAVFLSSAGRLIRPFSRTRDSSAGKQLSVAISIAASRHAPRPEESLRQSY